MPQVAVGRGDHPDIRLDEPRAAEALELAFLQHAQELRLRGEAHLGHLVEEQHAARRQFDLAGLGLVRAREGAALVSKQLGLEQLLGQRGAVQRDERSVPARRRCMDEPRDDFLAGARFAGNEHGGISRGDPRCVAQHPAPFDRLADDAQVGARRRMVEHARHGASIRWARSWWISWSVFAIASIVIALPVSGAIVGVRSSCHNLRSGAFVGP